MNPLVLGGCFASLVVLLAGCGEEPPACTLLAAEHGLTIAPRVSAVGTYRLSIESDVVAATCTLQFDQPDKPNIIDLAACTVQRGVVRHGSSSTVELVVSGDAVEGGLSPLPSSVRIELVKESSGEQVACRQVEPTYDENRPNGPDCDPEPYRTAFEYIGDSGAVPNLASNCN